MIGVDGDIVAVKMGTIGVGVRVSAMAAMGDAVIGGSIIGVGDELLTVLQAPNINIKINTDIVFCTISLHFALL